MRTPFAFAASPNRPWSPSPSSISIGSGAGISIVPAAQNKKRAINSSSLYLQAAQQRAIDRSALQLRLLRRSRRGATNEWDAAASAEEKSETKILRLKQQAPSYSYQNTVIAPGKMSLKATSSKPYAYLNPESSISMDDKRSLRHLPSKIGLIPSVKHTRPSISSATSHSSTRATLSSPSFCGKRTKVSVHCSRLNVQDCEAGHEKDFSEVESQKQREKVGRQCHMSYTRACSPFDLAIVERILKETSGEESGLQESELSDSKDRCVEVPEDQQRKKAQTENDYKSVPRHIRLRYLPTERRQASRCIGPVKRSQEQAVVDMGTDMTHGIEGFEPTPCTDCKKEYCRPVCSPLLKLHQLSQAFATRHWRGREMPCPHSAQSWTSDCCDVSMEQVIKR